jgi:hypothetical protein
MAEAAKKLGDSSESHFVYYLGSIKLFEKVGTFGDEIFNFVHFKRWRWRAPNLVEKKWKVSHFFPI